MNRLKIATIVLSITTASLAVYAVRITLDLARSEELRAVGGVDAYRTQRIQSLKSIRDRITIDNPVVRQQEIDAIDKQIAEIENEVTEELGEELEISN